MSVAILGGKAKGFAINLANKVSYRPTTVMLRRKFFDQKQDWENLIFVDLCAGSGAMGFEALSRGAKFVHFNDQEGLQAKVINENYILWCQRFPEDSDKAKITKGDGVKLISSFPLTSETWFFFDPPYGDDALYQKFINQIKQLKLQKNLGIIIECSIKEKKIPTWWSELDVFRQNPTFREVLASDRRILSFKGE